MAINSKIHMEHPAPPGVYWQRSDKCDEETDRQTKNSTLLVAPAAGEIRAPTKLGMVIEDLEHVLAPPQRLGV